MKEISLNRPVNLHVDGVDVMCFVAHKTYIVPDSVAEHHYLDGCIESIRVIEESAPSKAEKNSKESEEKC